MSRGRRERRVMAALLICVMVLALALGLAARGQQRTKVYYAQMQLQATDLLEECFAHVRSYKQELGIPMAQEDYHQTGMIGESYSGITTTLGACEAKRTTAWPEMGALCVRLLYEAGVRPGDKVGAGFSGSFPAMNLAVIAACQVMDVELVYISSVGASTYGANNPQLTFPEMAHRLVEDGVLATDSAAVTLGGEKDAGVGMDPALLQEITGRLEEAGLPLLIEEDFQKNMALRREIYEQDGAIDCFVAVGGNITSMGRNEAGLDLGQGLLDPKRVTRLTQDSGLVQYYLLQGVPAINLLNIKKLVADYGLPYDPEQWPEPGTSAVYYETSYPMWIVALGIGAAAVCLGACGWSGWKATQMQEQAYMRKEDLDGAQTESPLENSHH